MVQLKIKELATERGFNISRLQRKAGLTAGVTRRYWYASSTGRSDEIGTLRQVDLNTLESIAKVLNVTVSQLIDNDGR